MLLCSIIRWQYSSSWRFWCMSQCSSFSVTDFLFSTPIHICRNECFVGKWLFYRKLDTYGIAWTGLGTTRNYHWESVANFFLSMIYFDHSSIWAQYSKSYCEAEVLGYWHSSFLQRQWLYMDRLNNGRKICDSTKSRYYVLHRISIVLGKRLNTQ